MIKSIRNYKIRFLRIALCFALPALLSSCGGDGGNAPGTGSASFGLLLQTAGGVSQAPTTTPINCTDYGIDNIVGTATDSSGKEVATATWACTAHSGKLGNIPAGTVNIKIEGKLQAGTVAWRGTKSGVAISADKDTPAGSILMSFVGTDAVPTTVITAPTGSTITGGVASAITITFNEPMAATTINTNTIIVTSGSTTITGAINYDGTTNTATFTPSSTLDYATPYTVRVTSGVEDATGKNVAESQFNYTTSNPTSVPSAPTMSTPLVSCMTVTLNWNKPLGGVTSYNIYWGTSAGITKSNNTGVIASTTNSVTIIYGPPTYVQLDHAEIPHYYVVTAVNSIGESIAVSNEVSATPTIINCTQGPPPPPPKPMP